MTGNKEYIRLLEETLNLAEETISNNLLFCDLQKASKYLRKKEELARYKDKKLKEHKERNR